MTVTDDLHRQLLDHIADDHKRGCQGREYMCDCRYDMKTEQLLVAAAGYIKHLEQRIDRLQTGLDEQD